MGNWEELSIHKDLLSSNLKKFSYRNTGKHDLYTFQFSQIQLRKNWKVKFIKQKSIWIVKRDPRLSSTVVIWMSISLENSVIRGSPRSTKLRYILQGKMSPTLGCFLNIFPSLKGTKNKGVNCRDFSRKSDDILRQTHPI